MTGSREPEPIALPPALVAELRGLLLIRRGETQGRLASLTGHFQDIVDASTNANVDDEHDPEGATIAFERSQVDTLARDAKRELADVADALARLESGTYGRCEACGRPIAVERLKARPTARTCVACAARP